jgi:hypothetical protein
VCWVDIPIIIHCSWASQTNAQDRKTRAPVEIHPISSPNTRRQYVPIISTGAGPGIALEVASGNSVSLVLVPSGLILKRCEQIWFMRHGTLRKHLRYSALVLCLVFGSVQWQTTDACQICRLAFAISVG